MYRTVYIASRTTGPAPRNVSSPPSEDPRESELRFRVKEETRWLNWAGGTYHGHAPTPLLNLSDGLRANDTTGLLVERVAVAG